MNQDNASSISRRGSKKFTISFVKSGNINMLNDVLKTVHNSGHKIYQVGILHCLSYCCQLAVVYH